MLPALIAAGGGSGCAADALRALPAAGRCLARTAASAPYTHGPAGGAFGLQHQQLRNVAVLCSSLGLGAAARRSGRGGIAEAAAAAVRAPELLLLLPHRQRRRQRPAPWPLGAQPALLQLLHQQQPWQQTLQQPWQQQQQLQQCAGFSSAASGAGSASAPGGGGGGDSPPKSARGRLPSGGPAHRTLRALPFVAGREAAEAAFSRYHASRSWFQSRQTPVLAKPPKESFLPFWVGSGAVTVEVRGAETGHERLVTRYDPRTRRDEPRWETVWSRVQVHLVWQRQLRPEEPDMQLYAGYKYNRRDIEQLRPGERVKLAQPITPPMLQAAPGSSHATRRVGPYTLEPLRAARLLMAEVESQERKVAEEQIARITGASQVRFVDMHCTWQGSTSGRQGLDLAPVYVPAYVFSWWHGGAKVRTFVSGVDAGAVSGAQVLDDKKLAVMAAGTTASTALLLGVSLPVVFWAGFVVPFLAVGLVARFWPTARTAALDLWERLRERWDRLFHRKGAEHADYCEVDWNASFVKAYEAFERHRQQAEQRQEAFWRASHWPGGDGAGDPFAAFQQALRDPLGFFERLARAQQQRQQQARGGSGAGGGWQQQDWQRVWEQWQQEAQRTAGGASAGQQQQQRRQQQQQQRAQPGGGGGYSGGYGGGGAAPRGPPRDPRGYYSALGVTPGCTAQELQAAFRGLALQHHPDRYTGEEDKRKATARFQGITEAYQVLRDPKKRQAYDAGTMA